MQTSLLNTALKAEEDAFDRSVSYALNKTIHEISQHEAKSAILKLKFKGESSDGKVSISKETVISESDTSVLFWNDRSLKNDSLTIDLFYQDNDNDKMINMIVIDTTYDSVHHSYSYGYTVHEDSLELFGEFNIDDSSRIMLLDAALGQLERREKVPISERLDSLVVDSILKKNLLESDIKLEYEFGVLDRFNDSLYIGNRDNNKLIDPKNNYRAILFPFDVTANTYLLVLNLPNKDFFIYSKLFFMIISILIFVTVIIICFIYSIKIILQQRKTANHLTDFINNMTHEFKTPLSTIRLAVEAIGKDEVLDDKDQLKRFSEMILSENLRMKNQVDKILQIATLEEGDYIINKEVIDMHSVIDRAFDSFTVHVKAKLGKIEKNYSADNSIVEGDRVHLNNIIHNLLDNSIKYSPNRPEISIKTENIENRLKIVIKDNGIGIAPEDQKLIFNRYFRVSKGDIHDVKGFGLGLSYVKMMVEAHQGHIKINSALDKGCEVIITLPTI